MIRPEPRQRPRRPDEPAADQPGKKKPPTPEREIGSSVKVADHRRKVAKSQTLAGKSQSRKGESRKVAQHSRKP